MKENLYGYLVAACNTHPSIAIIHFHDSSTLTLPCPVIHAPLKPLLSKFQAHHSSETSFRDLKWLSLANSVTFPTFIFLISGVCHITKPYFFLDILTLLYIGFHSAPSNYCLGFKTISFLRNSSYV